MSNTGPRALVQGEHKKVETADKQFRISLMKVSAILLCYNQKKFIAEQFRALLAQDYEEDFEIIISDDASTDGSYEYLKELVETEGGGRNIILNRNPINLGIAGNLQSAVDLSHGEWIIKFDGDDIARKDRISVSMKLTEDYPGYLIYTHSAYDIDSDGELLFGEIPKDQESVITLPFVEHLTSIDQIRRNMGNGAMYHRSLFTDFNRLPPGANVADDKILSFRCYLKKSGIAYSGKRCTAYRQHQDNVYHADIKDPKELLIKQCNVQLSCWYFATKDLCDKWIKGEMSYKEVDRLMRFMHAEQRRLLLFPYATYEGNLWTKVKSFWVTIKCRPEMWLVSIPRLFPPPFVRKYLKVKEKIKRLIKR
jgi:glycosyltransferase involved in cell wall biosynthesis